MARTTQSNIAPTHKANLTIRTREPLAQNDIITPVPGKFISTQADRCPFPGCLNNFPHQHLTAETRMPPSIEEYRKAGEAIRLRWSEEQRRMIAENEAVLSQLAEVEPKVGTLSLKTHSAHGDELTDKERLAIIHGGATPTQYEATREMLSERLRQDVIDNTSPISPVFPAGAGVADIKMKPQNQAEEAGSIEWNDFPELDHKYPTPLKLGTPERLNHFPKTEQKTICAGNLRPSPASTRTQRHYSFRQNIDFLNTKSPLCTGPCPIQTPHNQGAYLQQGQVPRTWNARLGYSDPPREIWEAWVRIEQGCGRSWDQVEVDGFALSHWWAGP